MNKHNVIPFQDREQIVDPLTDLLRSGARQLIHQAVQAEFDQFLKQYDGHITDSGHAAVVRNGYHPEREIQTSMGPVPVKIPKARSRTGEPVTFRSALVPPYIRKAKSLEAAIPWLYLKGISSGEMSEALKVLVGPDAAGLSASTVSRLKLCWAKEYDAFRVADLSKSYCQIWCMESLNQAAI